MSLRPVATLATLLSPLLFALAGMLAAQGAHAQSVDASPVPGSTSETALIRIHEDAVRPAAAPREPVDESDRPTQMNQHEREVARAKRLERREIISEGIGISVDDLNDLLRRVRPTAEERRHSN